MASTILVINTGSATVKFAIFKRRQGGGIELQQNGTVDGIGKRLEMRVRDSAERILAERADAAEADHAAALSMMLEWIDAETGSTDLLAAGHRVVHGGEIYRKPVLVDDEAIGRLRSLEPLAPLHQPHNVAGIEAVRRLKADLPQVACFDTAFHRSQPTKARTFALPRALTESGVVRYGFHGISYAYIADVLPDHLGDMADGRVVVAHLGHGASMCAMHRRQSVATTMGFTPLDGLVMGSRCGDLDPGVVLYLLQEGRMETEEIVDLLYRRSGLAGVSEISGDMRELLASSDPRAHEAVDLFVYRAIRTLGSMAAALGGLDALVFTGGIGENAAAVRERICEQSGWLGIELDREANEFGSSRISTPASSASAWVIPTDEALMIARATEALMRDQAE